MNDLTPFDEFEYESDPLLKGPWKPKLQAIRWSQLDDVGQESEWLVRDVITAGEVSVVGGPSQHGKSFFAVHLGMSVTTGDDFFGHPVERGGVLYIAAESGRGLKKRLRAFRSWNDIQKDQDLPFILLPGKFNLFAGDADTDALIEDGKEWNAVFLEEFGVPLRLIIVDTFAAATAGADENSARDVTPVLARAQRISAELRCAVSVVHHMNAGGSKLRGHSSIFANVENVVSVEMAADRVDEDGRAIRHARVAKQKDAESGETWRFVLRAVEIGMDKYGKPVTSCVCVPPNEDIDVSGPADGGFKASEKDKQFLTCLLDAMRDRGQIPPQDVPCPARINRVVHLAHVKKLMWERYAGGEDGDDKAKKNAMAQRWKRAHDRMVQYQIVGSADPWLWPTGKPVQGLNMGGERKKEPPAELPLPTMGPDEDFLNWN